MQGMRCIFLAGFLMITCASSYPQTNRQLQSLHDRLLTGRPPGYDSSQNMISYLQQGSLNYLYPLYQLYGEEQKFKALLPDPIYHEELSRALAFAGDYESALEVQKQIYDSSVNDVIQRQIFKTIKDLKEVHYVDAKRYISFLARDYRVIMINEASNKPLHRAFTISLLQDLYNKGFHYLAMEMLNNYDTHSLDKLNYLTGHFCAEPVAGELIRRALDLGYKLVSYEDTLPSAHTATQRDSIQAANIYQVLVSDPSARILVHAGYGHIAESTLDSNYIPMGMAFKKISGIDPLTIDQTDMTEDGEFEYGKVFYDAYIQKYPPNSPSIALVQDKPLNVTFSHLYDLGVIHPRTTYRDGRPTWLGLGGRRQPIYIKPPSGNTFFVQAYYQFESFGNKPGHVIPADQTYVLTSKGSYLLYLERGKYIILFRDMGYKILRTQHIEVN
jgi:uncharacterized iron-regulated protein